MVAAGIVLLFIALVIIYWNISYSPYKHAFIKQMEQKTDNVSSSNQVCTKEDIESLPEPLQRYCNYIGLEGFPKYQVVRTIFSHTDFVFDDTKGQKLDMDYDLWLFYDKPYRSAYCQSSMRGIPFDGIDYSTEDNEGGMKGILGKAIKIFDVHNKQGYQAQLISWFAESLSLNPSVLFSSFVTYEPVSSNQVKVTITKDDISGSGIITFAKNGAVSEFYSDDRQVEKINGVDTRIGWRCEYEDYRMGPDILQVHTVRSIKVYPDKEVTYFESDNFAIEYLK